MQVIKVITNLEEMKAISREWREMAMRFETPLLQCDWFLACAETLCQPDQLRIFVHHSRDGLKGVAPLVLTRNEGPERLEILGTSVLDEPTGFIYDNEASLRELMAAILKMRKPLLFRRLRHDSAKIKMLSQFSVGKYFLRNETGSPFFDIKTTWDEFLAGMTSDNRNHLRRKQKLLEKEGKVSFEIISPSFDRLDRDLEEVIRVEGAGWKEKTRTSLDFDDRLRRFYKAYVREAGRQGSLRLCFLRIDEKAIAAQIAVFYAKRFWLLKIGYDEKWSKYSPGVLLTHETIRYAFQQGLEGFEFLGHDEQWIRRWTHQIHPYVTLRSYPFSFSGMGGFAYDAFNSVLKKVSHRRV